LQKGEIVVAKRDRIERLLATCRQRVAPTHRSGQAPGRYHLFHVLDHQVGQQPLQRRQQIADLGRDHGAHLRVADHLLQRVCKIFQHHNGAHIGVFQLVLQLARGVERVHIHHHHAGAQHTEQGHRVLQQVGHHQRDAVAALQLGRLLQPSSKRVAGLVQLAEGHRGSHRAVGRQIGKTLAAVALHVGQRAEALQVDLSRYANRVLGKPRLVHGTS
jgi:hypothetical protein